MDSQVQISKLEKVLINLASPANYVIAFGRIPFREFTRKKEEDYKRLISYLEDDGRIPFKVQALYHATICGNITVMTAYVRKYLV